MTAVEDRICDAKEADPVHGDQCIWIMLKNPASHSYDNGGILTATIRRIFPSGGLGWATEVHDYNWSPAFVP
jgi:hypothetical protein